MQKSESRFVVLLIGPPGSGKSSIALKVKKIKDISIIGTGNLLRTEITNKTNTGIEIKKSLDKGQLASTELVSKIILNKLEDISQQTILFDGFPRIEEQIDSFFKICHEADLKLKSVIVLDVSRGTVIKRLSGRRVCKRCGEIYNIYFNPPPQDGKCRCGDNLETRDDDKPDVVEKRLDLYEKETSPVVKYFQNHYTDITFFISGEKSVEEVADKMLMMIE